jgi:MATE family multidrug resistance protein
MAPVPATPLRVEVRRLASLAVPVAATQLSGFLLGFVDTLMVGRVSVEAMGAASLANVWSFGTLLCANGIIFAIDPIVSQAHGAGDGERAGLALQRGLVLALGLSVPVAALWLLTGSFLRLAGQEPELARMAHVYTLMKIPSIPFFLSYSALRQYLQGREMVRPALWIILAANAFNVFFNWLLIFGNLGLPALGLTGAGIATTLTRIAACAGLAGLVVGLRLHAHAWVPWSRAAFQGLGALVALGLPIAIQLSTEIWAFSSAALLAGLLGAESLAAHAIAMNMAGLVFMIPQGISQAATTRVGNLIGAGRALDAQRAAWVAMAMGAGVMTISALAFVELRHLLPRVYTSDAGVIVACAGILPIAAAFQVFDGTQVVGCGILRGMGRTRPAAVFNVIGYWLLGLPLGAWLGVVRGGGIEGIWWGLCAGLAVVASLLVVWIRVRGPARVDAAIVASRP